MASPHDPWTLQVAALAGTSAPPIGRWPPGRQRLIVDGKPAHRMVRPAALPPRLHRDSTDRELLRHIAVTGSITAPELALAARIDCDAARDRLKALAARGQLQRQGNVWQVVG